MPDSVSEVYNRVLGLAVASPGVEVKGADDDERQIIFQRGSVVGFIKVIPHPSLDKLILIVIHIPVVIKPQRLDGHTLLKLMQMNSTILYGALGYNRDENIITLNYSLLGNSLDPEELIAALEILSAFADSIDEELCELTGGKRGIDYIQGIQ